jgi:hypothetical protein
MSSNDLAVLIRSRGGEPIDESIESIVVAGQVSGMPEVLVVSTGDPKISESNRRLVRVLISPAKRIEAKAIGVNMTSASRVLFLDSDQSVSEGLLMELNSRSEEMVLIPERSRNRNIMGAILDSRRALVESQMRRSPDVRLAVVPRFFKRSLLRRAFESMPDEVVHEVTETEDSLIFFECLKLCSTLGWTDSMIYNDDPGVFAFLKKSYSYGYRNETAINLGHLPADYVALIRSIQAASVLNSGLLSPGSAVSRVLRGVPYLAGTVAARLGIKEFMR